MTPTADEIERVARAMAKADNDGDDFDWYAGYAHMATAAIQAMNQRVPVAWLLQKDNDREIEWTRLTDADKAAGWTETPLYK